MSKSEKGMVILYIKRTYSPKIRFKIPNKTPSKNVINRQKFPRKMWLLNNHSTHHIIRRKNLSQITLFAMGLLNHALPPKKYPTKTLWYTFPHKKYKNHVHPMSTPEKQICTKTHICPLGKYELDTNYTQFKKISKIMHIFCTFFVTVGG